MEKMTWDNNSQCYIGDLENGTFVSVTGDEWSESVADGINALISDRKIDRAALSVEEDAALIDKLEDEVLAELDSPNMWASLVGDNQNVEIIDA